MSNAPSTPATPPVVPSAEAKSEPERIYLVSFPKIVFMYPTFVMAILAGIVASFADPHGGLSHSITAIFLVVLALNLVVFAFDFPRTTALTFLFILTSIILLVLLVFRLNDQILPALSNLIKSYHPEANSTLFFSVAAILGVLFVAVRINVQFDYWEVTGNELLHHHGFMSNLKRFPAQQLRIEKEITDLFEWMLLRSGRLILTPSQEMRSIVLDNVLNINRKETRITEMLGALKVQIQPGSPHGPVETET
jgi:hypothetical protein